MLHINTLHNFHRFTLKDITPLPRVMLTSTSGKRQNWDMHTDVEDVQREYAARLYDFVPGTESSFFGIHWKDPSRPVPVDIVPE